MQIFSLTLLNYFLDKCALHRILIVTTFNLFILSFVALFVWYISKGPIDLKDLALCFICRKLCCLGLVLGPFFHLKFTFNLFNGHTVICSCLSGIGHNSNTMHH